MTEKELYATYKATAPGLDLDWFIAHYRYGDRVVQDEVFALKAFTKADGRIAGISRPEFYRRLRNVQDSWRRDSNRADRGIYCLHCGAGPADAAGELPHYRNCQDA